jgi:CNT family concentrative nucleoside transporter
MVGGMANIAGGVFAAYVGFLGGSDPEHQLYIARHLLSASIMSAPASVLCAKMLLPETEKQGIEKLTHTNTRSGENLLDAIATGTTDGLRLAVNVGAMLIVFTALVYMMNWLLMHTVGEWTGLNETIRAYTNNRFEGLTFTYIMGLLFAPVAWLIGVPMQDVTLIGQLLGMKTMINEFVAYSALGDMQTQNLGLSPRSVTIALYALCGFANFSSIAIQVGGIGQLAPERRADLARLGFKALICGTLASYMSATIAGLLF